MLLLQTRFFPGCHRLADWSPLALTGADAPRFLQGQLTSDVERLAPWTFHLSARLDRSGRVRSYFYLLKQEKDYLLLIPGHLLGDTRADLEKYVIMDEVEFKEREEEVTVVWDAALEQAPAGSFLGRFGGQKGYLCLGDAPALRDIPAEEFWTTSLLDGHPAPGLYTPEGQLLNETLLNLHAVSYQKGCFLGQESVAKIETRRGANRFPCVLCCQQKFSPGEELSLDSCAAGKILCPLAPGLQLASLKRAFRVEGKTYHLGDTPATVVNLPFFKEDKAAQLYAHAVAEFQAGAEERALELLERTTQIDPRFAAAFESLGAILGRLGRYQEGIEWMDKVLAIDPDSIMAHTNKSLFLMKLGRIEEAEEEKAQATVKTFAEHGRKAKEKRSEEERLQGEQQNMAKREAMFLEVLQIDPNDTMALYGLADIHHQRKEHAKAAELLEQLLRHNRQHSVAYTLLGKTHLASGEQDKARHIFDKGIEVATARGELKCAGEMQALLNALDTRQGPCTK